MFARGRQEVDPRTSPHYTEYDQISRLGHQSVCSFMYLLFSARTRAQLPDSSLQSWHLKGFTLFTLPSFWTRFFFFSVFKGKSFWTNQAGLYYMINWGMKYYFIYIWTDNFRVQSLIKFRRLPEAGSCTGGIQCAVQRRLFICLQSPNHIFRDLDRTSTWNRFEVGIPLMRAMEWPTHILTSWHLLLKEHIIGNCDG